MPPAQRRPTQAIRVEGATEHNLKNISLTLPRDALVVFTGVSGSGKSSLAFDTLYKEGQRRFLESLSPYARQFLGKMEKPQVEHIEGLSPTIAIEQKTLNRNPRSTVGTMTELYDHFRLWMARLGTPYCPQCQVPISSLSAAQIALHVLARVQPPGQTEGEANASNGHAKGPAKDPAKDLAPPRPNSVKGQRIPSQPAPWRFIYAPMVRERKGEYRKELADWQASGFTRVRVDGQLRRLEEEIVLARYEKHTLELLVDRMRLDASAKSRLVEGIEQALTLSKGLVVIEDEHASGQLFSSHLACPKCQQAIPELEPRLFSFNAPQGACPTCNGLGEQRRFDEKLLVQPQQALANGALLCLSDKNTIPYTHITHAMLCQAAAYLGIDPQQPWGQLTPQARHAFLAGQPAPTGATAATKGQQLPASRASNRVPAGQVPFRELFRKPQKLVDAAKKQRWAGLIPILNTLAHFAPAMMEKYQSLNPCHSCQGMRLNPWALAVRFENQRIHTLVRMTIEQAQRFFANTRLKAEQRLIGMTLLREIQLRLAFLKDVGVGYLSLERKAGTLSGGEAQRIRLAAQVGAGLQGVLYVLDEPSIGLHPADNTKLLNTLRELRDLGNSVVVVEHDEETILSADHVVDLGPGAGEQGGQLLAQGSPAQLLQSKHSLSAQYLRGEKTLPLPSSRRKASNQAAISLHQVSLHNLKQLSVHFPLGVLTVVTGVSGSGKSTLVHQGLKGVVRAHLGLDTSGIDPAMKVKKVRGVEQINQLIEIDQAPIGRTPRSNPATYTKAWEVVRSLFQNTPLAKTRGYKIGRFSFNVVGGRCEACQGAGVRTIEMQFLGDVETPCEVCEGKRFNEETLNVRYKGKSIADVLQMSLEQAHRFFENIPQLKRVLGALCAVGMGYVRLGQPSTTLSGGEAQRVKLAAELRKRATGKTLYLLDEPTTGLHFHDIQLLLNCLQTLVDQGNSVVVIEHNLDVIKTADHLIDLGPGGGEKGGSLIAQGTPEEVAVVKESLTGQSLAPYLAPRRPKPLNQPPPAARQEQQKQLVVHGAMQNNLQNLTVSLPKNALSVICGVSGCGKTSLLFDTIFAEGQARYVESLSTYARRFLGRVDKPQVERIEGLAPAIAIHQKTSARTPRSTVATATEVYDYLRLLFARLGQPHCPHCQQPLAGATPTLAAKQAQSRWHGQQVLVLAPLHVPNTRWAWSVSLPRAGSKPNATAKNTAKKTTKAAGKNPRKKTRKTPDQHLQSLLETLASLNQQGFTRLRLSPPNQGPSLQRIEELLLAPQGLQTAKPHDTSPAQHPCSPSLWTKAWGVELVVDRLRVGEDTRPRLAEALETAFAWGAQTAHLVAAQAPAVSQPAQTQQITAQPARITHGAAKNAAKNAATQSTSQPAQTQQITAQPARITHGAAKNATKNAATQSTSQSAQTQQITAQPACITHGVAKNAAKNAATQSTSQPAQTQQLTAQPACITHGAALSADLSTRLFSFNHHQGACAQCHGLGRAHQIDPERLVPFEEMPLLEGALAKGWLAQRFMRKRGEPRLAIEAFATQAGIALHKPFGKLSAQHQGWLLFGNQTSRSAQPSATRSITLKTRLKKGEFAGLNGLALALYFENPEPNSTENPHAQHVLPFLGQHPCPSCQGQRLGPLPRAVRLHGMNIADFCSQTVEEASQTLTTWHFEGANAAIAQAPLQEIRSRLRFLSEVGVGYLALGREASTLSGGEAQRIRLASQLGSNLVGVIYALDEPTIGLHPRDTAHLLNALKRLRDAGNTVLMIEHDPETIMNADWVLEIGPGAGHLGGKLVAQGTPKALCQQAHSLTGAYLSGKKQSMLQPSPLASKGELVVCGAAENNLRNIDAHFPLGGMSVVTGVSGSGKSSLVVSVLQRALARHLHQARLRPGRHQRIEGLDQVEKLVVIDQAPIGSTPRSIPATATGVMDKVRALFAQLPLAKARGYQVGRFSYNVAAGRCPACEGKGFQHIEMHFLADVWTPCTTCQGARYNPQTLEITFKGKHMADILAMEVSQALALFANQPAAQRILQTLVDVGLGYLKLGQTANTLSGGEAQRIKLAAELSKPSHGKTVYILDEPTTGLHMDDVAKLIVVLHRLRQQGNTVVVIEHNLEVICSADHLIDLGPEGGTGGGQLLYAGVPRKAVHCAQSATGKAIAQRLKTQQGMPGA